MALAGALYGGLLWVAFGLLGPHLLDRAESEASVFLTLQILDDGILGALGLGFGRLRFPGSWRRLGFRPARARWWWLGAGGGVAAAVVGWLITMELDRWGWPAPPHPVDSVLGAATGIRDVLVILLAVTVPVPIAEEVFFRGFAYRLLRAKWGVLPAIGSTSVLFALVHGLEPSVWLPVLPVGILFAVLAEHSGSLWPSVMAHAMVNALAVMAG